jgi:UDP-3-O-[3-hydroxymyristoyl] glucosamine N-acyltransferase
VRIERGSFIHKTADVSPDARIGRGTKIWNNVQIRERAVIGERCIVGKSVYIDHSVVVGDCIKIQNGVSVDHLPARVRSRLAHRGDVGSQKGVDRRQCHDRFAAWSWVRIAWWERAPW